MAQILEVDCRACGTCETQLDGPIFAGYRPRCQRCGEPRLVSLDRALPIEQDQQTREEWVVEQAGTCRCGGRFSTSAPIRCSACRSVDVSTTVQGTAD
jgi:hypothetical protein